MEITRSSIATAKGPEAWFTDDVYIDPVAAAPAPARVQANLVRFTPGARTAWHTHPLGQTIYVTEGVGLAQRRGGPIEVIRRGDRVFFEPDEDHWHGAAANRFMVHLALNEVDDEHVAVNWGRRSPTRSTRPHLRYSADRGATVSTTAHLVCAAVELRRPEVFERARGIGEVERLGIATTP